MAGKEDCADKGRFLEEEGSAGSLCHRYDSLISVLSVMQGFGPASTPYRLLPGTVAPASATDESIRAQVYCHGRLHAVSKRDGDGHWSIDPVLTYQDFNPLKEMLSQGVATFLNARRSTSDPDQERAAPTHSGRRVVSAQRTAGS